MTPECPKCHQYKVSTTTALIDQATGKAVSSKQGIALEAATPAVWTLWGIAILIPILQLCVALSAFRFNQLTPYDYLSFIITGLVLLTGVILYFRNTITMHRMRKETLLRAKYEIYHFCNNCHYEW